MSLIDATGSETLPASLRAPPSPACAGRNRRTAARTPYVPLALTNLAPLREALVSEAPKIPQAPATNRSLLDVEITAGCSVKRRHYYIGPGAPARVTADTLALAWTRPQPQTPILRFEFRLGDATFADISLGRLLVGADGLAVPLDGYIIRLGDVAVLLVEALASKGVTSGTLPVFVRDVGGRAAAVVSVIPVL